MIRIDMDFMNENQSAHGDREYGHIVSRMGIERKVIVGHLERSKKFRQRIASWMRTGNWYHGEQPYPCYENRR